MPTMSIKGRPSMEGVMRLPTECNAIMFDLSILASFSLYPQLPFAMLPQTEETTITCVGQVRMHGNLCVEVEHHRRVIVSHAFRSLVS
eukprot:3015304-Amphidinium_carterae.1